MEKIILDEEEAKEAFYSELRESGFPRFRFSNGKRYKKPKGPWTEEYPLGIKKEKDEVTWWESLFTRKDGTSYSIFTPLGIPGIVIDPGAKDIDEKS